MLTRLLARQEVRYLIVGGWNALFGPGCFLSCYWLLRAYVHYMIIYVVTSVLAITVAYVLYKYFVFRTRGDILREGLRFFGVYGVSMLFGLVSLPFCMEVLRLNVFVSQLIIMAVTVVGSFFCHKHFSFRRRNINR